jgi:hypothetical protein
MLSNLRRLKEVVRPARLATFLSSLIGARSKAAVPEIVVCIRTVVVINKGDSVFMMSYKDI